MINGQKVSLCMPCRNEAKHVADVLKYVPKEVDEILIVDNNSQDDIAKTLKSIGYKRVKLLHDKRTDSFGVGYGYAHTTGLKQAKGDIIVCADADGSYPLDSLVRAVKHLQQNNLDMLICQRRANTMSWFARLGGQILYRQIKARLNIDLKDPLSGMWVVNKKSLPKLHLKEGGWDFSLEIKLQALTNPDFKTGTLEISQDSRFGHSKQSYVRTGFMHMMYIKKYSEKL